MIDDSLLLGTDFSAVYVVLDEFLLEGHLNTTLIEFCLGVLASNGLEGYIRAAGLEQGLPSDEDQRIRALVTLRLMRGPSNGAVPHLITGACDVVLAHRLICHFLNGDISVTDLKRDALGCFNTLYSTAVRQAVGELALIVATVRDSGEFRRPLDQVRLYRACIRSRDRVRSLWYTLCG